MLAPFRSRIGRCSVEPMPLRRRRAATGVAWIIGVVVVSEVVALSGVLDRIAGAWNAGCRGQPTAAQQATGIDLAASTHEWFASRALAIVEADGHDQITAFLRSPDPTAPAGLSPSVEGSSIVGSYGWRFVKGAADADCELYSQIPDHLHNFWSHRGRRMIIGSSAASNAETAFSNAVDAGSSGDRATAMQWLGASLHLVQDACAPQHNFYGIGVNHSAYEHLVRTHQDALAVDGPPVLAGDFRPQRGHGGGEWSSQHPRGWADECAHRSAGVLRAAAANVPSPSTDNDPQWATADHIAFTQRLGAGYLLLFFDRVGAP